MRKNDEILHAFFVGISIIGIVTVIWAIVKASQVHWQIYNLTSLPLNIWAAVFGGLLLFIYGTKENLYYHRYKRIEQGYDERNWKILTFSLRNIGVGLLAFLYLAVLYYSLSYGFSELIFSLNSINWVFALALIIFFSSLWYYSRSKRL